MVQQDVFKVTAYSLLGASSALYSINALYNAFLQHRKIKRLQHTPQLQKTDLELNDFQVIQSHIPVGYFKIQGRISSNSYLTSVNGLQCFYYENSLNYSQYTSNLGIKGTNRMAHVPFWVRCYNIFIDSCCYVLFLTQRLVSKWNNPFNYSGVFTENIGTIIERKSTNLTLTTYEGIPVHLDLTGSLLDLREIGNEKVIQQSDHVTAIGYIHSKEGQLIMSAPFIKWYLITNKEPGTLMKEWWRRMIWCCLQGIGFGIIGYYSFYKIDLLLQQLQPIMPAILQPIKPSFLEWMANVLRIR